MVREGWTLRDVIAHRVIDYHPLVAGTATDVVGHMQEWFGAGRSRPARHGTSPVMPTTSPKPALAALHALRDAMATVASPVAVVTAMDGRRPHGTTVSAFASLSLAPPMVVVSLDERSPLLAVVHRTGRFGLNVLAPTRPDSPRAFSVSGPDKFDTVAWSPGRLARSCRACRPRWHGSPPRSTTTSPPGTTPTPSPPSRSNEVPAPSRTTSDLSVRTHPDALVERVALR
ncbi:flavin reductase family protein [Streptomyces canus]|uniref:flavin reductase family protein n=1 Tax=Streptomyces canus TaxID=58343 RepID=UPI0037173AA3